MKGAPDFESLPLQEFKRLPLDTKITLFLDGTSHPSVEIADRSNPEGPTRIPEPIVRHRDKCESAFKGILKELHDVIKRLTKQLKSAANEESFDDVNILGQKAKEIKAFRVSVQNLAQNWHRLRPQTLEPAERVSTRPILPKGTKTPETEFYKPILETLIEMGGQGTIKHVLDKVGAKMADVLKPIDRAPLKSGKSVRWRNTAQWARNKMRTLGLLKAEAPRGIWEITEQGRAHFAQLNVKGSMKWSF